MLLSGGTGDKMESFYFQKIRSKIKILILKNIKYKY